MFDTQIALAKCESLKPQHCIVFHEEEIVFDGRLKDLLNEYPRLSKKDRCIVCLSPSDHESFTAWNKENSSN